MDAAVLHVVAAGPHGERRPRGDHLRIARRGADHGARPRRGRARLGPGAGLGAAGRLRYLWHLFFDPSEATEVELTFTAVPAGTAVRLEQRGWDKLGEAAPPRRERTGQVWGALTGEYARACAAEPALPRARERARPKVTAAADQTAAISRASDQAGGGVFPMCLIVTVPVLSGWRLPGA